MMQRRDLSSTVFHNSAELCKNREYLIKGSVQRKLRWVENGLNRSVGASDCGAGHSFVVLFGFHFDFTIFPFSASTAQFIG
jgi:hypothetical protein